MMLARNTTKNAAYANKSRVVCTGKSQVAARVVASARSGVAERVMTATKIKMETSGRVTMPNGRAR